MTGTTSATRSEPREPAVRLGVGVHNALTARIAERAGFDFAWVSAGELAARFAAPHAARVGPTEVAAVTAQVRAACGLRVYSEMPEDTGEGSTGDGSGAEARAVAAVRRFERAGAAAVCLRDGSPGSPAPAGRSGAAPDGFLRRLAAVRAAGTGVRLIAGAPALTAGTDAGQVAERLRAYGRAGADAVLVEVDHSGRHLLEPVLARLGGAPAVLLDATGLPAATVDELAGLGVAEVVFPDVVARVIRASLSETLAAVRRSARLADVTDRLATVDEVFDLMIQR